MQDGQIIISRKLVNGRSINKINGETVPVAALRRAAGLLIDIHGQHEHQTLLQKKNHLAILDSFAGDAIKEAWKPTKACTGNTPGFPDFWKSLPWTKGAGSRRSIF